MWAESDLGKQIWKLSFIDAHGIALGEPTGSLFDTAVESSNILVWVEFLLNDAVKDKTG